ncbi:hypothetical protein CCMA1212_005497 [Trichoderma ghanense]|uniref:Bacteriophage T5 Orf172 DNA-binding domain-containing protein n=1 Tax=Trichoderma ghanense TaxID=65468 RepID=A0ABY2H477_9HYPO
MATAIMTQNPVFEALATIQADIDKFPNPGDDHDFIRCRGLVGKTRDRCLNSSCKKSEREKVESLFSNFQNMAECPETESFYQDVEFFVTYTHCSKHRKAVETAFKKWKNLRLATASTPRWALPGAFPLDSPVESPASSVDAIFSPAMSQSSEEMFHCASPDALLCDEPDSYCAPEDDEDPLMTGIISQMAATKIDTSHQVDETEDQEIRYRKKGTKIPGLGIGNLPRALSLTDYTMVLRAFHDRPSSAAMDEASIYVLELLAAPGFFKVGVTGGDTAKRRGQQACFRKNSRTVYQSKTNFQGARKAEKLIHAELYNHKFLIEECEACGGRHHEVFKAPEAKIREVVEKIESIVQLPVYFQQGENWKLSEEAKDLLHTIYAPSPGDWRAILREKMGPGRAQAVMSEATRQDKLPPDANKSKSRDHATEADFGEQTGEGILERGWRALIGGFSRESSVE